MRIVQLGKTKEDLLALSRPQESSASAYVENGMLSFCAAFTNALDLEKATTAVVYSRVRSVRRFSVGHPAL